MKKTILSLLALFCFSTCIHGCSQGTSSSNASSNFKSKLPHVDDSNFQSKVLSSEKPVLVDFYAVWCGPCKRIAPIVEEVANENAEKLAVVKLNTDDSPKISQQYQIRGIPTLVLFQNGKEVDRVVGLVGKNKIQNLVDKAN